MEKYSAYRDAGTGIQPFLKPVPPNAPTFFSRVLVPLGFLLGIIRTVLILSVGVLYVLLVEVTLKVFYPLQPLYTFLSWMVTAVLARLVLLILGLWWIPTTYVTRKRGRNTSPQQPWNPKPGDIIISNWASWVEILWLASRFDPIFVMPVTAPIEKIPFRLSAPISSTPGRHTGTGSAAISSPAARPPVPRVPILGFQIISLLQIIRLTGSVPPFNGLTKDPLPLDKIRQNAHRPLVIFPECTTSNGRAMLRFADVFDEYTLPVKAFKVFVMCVRYDPPTLYTPTLTCSIPSLSIFNPLHHMFQVATCLSPVLSKSLSIRLLNPAESPSSGSFLASEVLSGSGYKDELAEGCSVLIAQLGKMRITGQAWEDKVSFLEFYRGKTGR